MTYLNEAKEFHKLFVTVPKESPSFLGVAVSGRLPGIGEFSVICSSSDAAAQIFQRLMGTEPDPVGFQQVAILRESYVRNAK